MELPVISINPYNRETVSLLKGREGNPEEGKARIIGITLFAAMVRQIFEAFQKDCPWAAYSLVLLEKQIEQTDKEFEELLLGLEDLLKEHNIKIPDKFEDKRKPMEYQFVSAHPYQVIRIILKFDALISRLKLQKNAGLLTKENYLARQREYLRILRRLLAFPTNYTYSGLSFGDYASKNAKVLAAIEKLGEVPPEVLSKQLLPSYEGALPFQK